MIVEEEEVPFEAYARFQHRASGRWLHVDPEATFNRTNVCMPRQDSGSEIGLEMSSIVWENTKLLEVEARL